MKPIPSFILCLLSLTLFVSCSVDDNPTSSVKITGSGNITTIERTLPNFQSVNFRSAGDVNITMGAQHSVSISVDDNIHQYITTTVVNGVLIIGSAPNTTFSNMDLNVNLVMTGVEELVLTGAGNITNTGTIQEDELIIDLPGAGNIILNAYVTTLSSLLAGAGNIILSGSATNHACNHPGAGNVIAFDFITDTTVINLSGVGNIELYADDYLNGVLSGVGTIYYKGQPSINLTVTGSGSLIDAN
ncbi:MAG: head GIN domain-containing protein [Candidatus Zixiibacteriota bacterium]